MNPPNRPRGRNTRPLAPSGPITAPLDVELKALARQVAGVAANVNSLANNQAELTKSQAELTKSQTELTRDVREIVDAWKATSGAWTVLKWMAKAIGVCAAVAAGGWALLLLIRGDYDGAKALLGK